MRSLMLRKALLVLLATLAFGKIAFAEPMRVEMIRSFYASYLEYLKNPSGKGAPDLEFSTEFKEAIAENTGVCKEFATGVCGFGADGDIYLDSQEYEPGLTLSSSGFSASEAGESLVTVSLNVYPSVSTNDRYYEKQVTFKLVREGGTWVVDDILYADQVSSRARIGQENEFYRKNPDPDSAYAKRKARD